MIGELDSGFSEIIRTFDAAKLLVRHPSLTGAEGLEFIADGPVDDLGEVPEPLRPAAALLGQELRFEADRLGRVYNAEYLGELPDLAPPAESWRLFLDDIFAVAPDADVFVGDAWNAAFDSELPTGPIALDRRTKFQTVRRAAGVRTAVIAMLTEPVEPIDPNEVLVPGEVALASYTQHGQARFDLIRGEIESCNLSTITQFRAAHPTGEVITQRLSRIVEMTRVDPNADADADGEQEVGKDEETLDAAENDDQDAEAPR
ncbi:MAG: hypothetical protein AAF138_01175 [Planctomycetota bacterium]